MAMHEDPSTCLRLLGPNISSEIEVVKNTLIISSQTYTPSLILQYGTSLHDDLQSLLSLSMSTTTYIEYVDDDDDDLSNMDDEYEKDMKNGSLLVGTPIRLHMPLYLDCIESYGIIGHYLHLYMNNEKPYKMNLSIECICDNKKQIDFHLETNDFMEMIMALQDYSMQDGKRMHDGKKRHEIWTLIKDDDDDDDDLSYVQENSRFQIHCILIHGKGQMVMDLSDIKKDVDALNYWLCKRDEKEKKEKRQYEYELLNSILPLVHDTKVTILLSIPMIESEKIQMGMDFLSTCLKRKRVSLDENSYDGPWKDKPSEAVVSPWNDQNEAAISQWKDEPSEAVVSPCNDQNEAAISQWKDEPSEAVVSPCNTLPSPWESDTILDEYIHNETTIDHSSENNSNAETTISWLEEYKERRQRAVSSPSRIISSQNVIKIQKNESQENTTLQALHDILYDAHLPKKAPHEADVSGLAADSAITIKRAEGDLLRSNYDALLSVVKEQQYKCEALQETLSIQKEETIEVVMKYDITMESLKLENLRLHATIRQLQSSSLHHLAFQETENHIGLLETEVGRLRQDNVQLLSEKIKTPKIRNHLTAMATECKEMSRELRIRKINNRKSLISQTLVGVSSKRIEQLQRSLNDVDTEVVSLRLANAELVAAARQLEHDVSKNEKNAKQMNLEVLHLSEENVSLKMEKSTLDYKTRQAQVLNKFVKRQLPSQPSTTPSNSTQINDLLLQLRSEYPGSKRILMTLQVEIEALSLQVSNHNIREEELTSALMECTQQPILSLRDQIQAEMATF